MKHLKRLLLIALLLPITVFAQNYEIKEVNTHITMPDDWYVFTKENLKDNAKLKEINITEEYMKNFFTTNRAYLDAMPKTFAYEFVLRTKDVEKMNNLSNYTDDEVKEVAKEIGKRVYSSTNDIYKTNYKYVESYYYDSTNKMYIASYYTVVNRLGYTFTAQKSANFTETEKNQIRDIIKSVSYDIKPEYKEEEKTSFNFNNILIYAAIGGVAGGLASYIASKKKKNQAN